MDALIKCQQCGTPMKRTKKAERNMALQLLGCLVFLVGIALLFLVLLYPLLGIAGLILMLVAVGLGYNKKKVWLCPNCGFFFERAK